MVRAGAAMQFRKELRFRLPQNRVISFEPSIRGNGKARRAKPFLNGYKMTGIDLAGAGSAKNGMARAAAKKRQAAGRLQRKRSVFAKQYRAFAQERPKRRKMGTLIILHLFSSF